MALYQADAKADTSSTTGTSDFVLIGTPPDGFNAMVGNVTDGATVRYRAQTLDNSIWEVNSGTYTAATKTLTRGTPTASSNSGAKASFAGTVYLFNVVTAADVDVGATTHAATGKTTPVDADELPIVDSAASNVLKKLTWANLKATLKTYLDTLYQTILVSGTSIKTINSTSLLGSGDIAISGMNLTANTFTGAQEVDIATSANTSADGLVLATTSAASAGNQQDSPRIRLRGNGWKTASTAASQPVDWTIENVPVQGTSAPTSQLVFSQQINGGGYTMQAKLDASALILNAGSSTIATWKAISDAGHPALYYLRDTDTNPRAAVYVDGFKVGAFGLFGFTANNANASTAPDTAISRTASATMALGSGAQGSTAGDLQLRQLMFKTTFTVATLPSASTSGSGALAYATDLSALTNGSTAAGSGSNKGVVKSDGTNWIVLG